MKYPVNIHFAAATIMKNAGCEPKKRVNSIISCKGGMAGTYVKTNGKSGKAALKIHSVQVGEICINFEIIVDKKTLKLYNENKYKFSFNL